MHRTLALALTLWACDQTTTDDDEPDGPCDPGDERSLEFGQALLAGPQVDGAPISYGTPPQGGAPYAPFQVKVKAEIEPGVRVPLDATAVEVATGEVLGSASQAQAFICSNTGPLEGWLYGGEVHVRFPDVALEDLDGREIEVSLVLDDGVDLHLEAGTSGVLSWDL